MFLIQAVFELLADLLKFLKKPIEQSSLWLDYFKTRRKAVFFRRDEIHADKWGKHAIFISIDAKIYEAKEFSMLALGLRRNGWQVSFLLNNTKNRWIKRYLKIYGFSDFLYWNILEQKFAKSTAHYLNAEIKSLLSKSLSFDQVKNWTLGKCYIGAQILSSISRSTYSGTPDFKSPVVRKQVEDRLIDAAKRVKISEGLVDEHKPDLIIIKEANYSKYAPITDICVASNIDVIQVTQPNRDDALIFRRLNKETRRQHPSSVTYSNFQSFKNRKLDHLQEEQLDHVLRARYSGKWFLQKRNQPNSEDYAKGEIFKRYGLDQTKKLAVVFSHVLWDANLFYGEDLFKDYGDWFEQTVKAACENDRVNWLIKMHPANLWKRSREGVEGEYAEISIINDSIGKLPLHVKILDPSASVSTLSLYESIDYAITVRGTAATEAPCFGVPTLTAGTGRCDGFGFTIDSFSCEEYLNKLDTIEKIPKMNFEQIGLARIHAYLAFCKRPWIFKSWKANFTNFGVSTPLETNLIQMGNSWSDIDENQDIEQWVNWANDRSEVDFLSR